MKKKNNIPTEFDDLLGNIGYNNPEEGGGITDIDEMIQENQPDVEEIIKNEPPVNNPEDGNNSGSDDPNAPEDPTEADIVEAQQVSLLFEAIGNSLGWNMDEIDDKDKPVTVDELTKYFSDVVEQNSKPEYADERIQALDEYVRNGGKFEDYYRKQQETLTLDNIDLEDETNQKAVLREFMQRAGYSDEQINKKITRYEDSDVLYDEAEDALDRLKQIRQQEVEEAARQQEEAAKQQEEQSKAFFDTVTKDINSLTNIRGIAVPKEDRKALFDYIFKVDQNGQSQYTKDFNKNLSKNLIESAYFTMKADSLISTAKKTGESSAADKLRNMLRHSAKNHSTFNADEKQKSATDLLNGLF